MAQIARNLGGYSPMSHEEQVVFWHNYGYDFNPENGDASRTVKNTQGLDSDIAPMSK